MTDDMSNDHKAQDGSDPLDVHRAEIRARGVYVTPFRLGMQVGESGAEDLPSPYTKRASDCNYQEGVIWGKRRRQEREMQAPRSSVAFGLAQRLAELVLSMDLASTKGQAARQLAREVLDNKDDLLASMRLIEHATKPEPNDGGYHEAAHEIAVAAIMTTDHQAQVDAAREECRLLLRQAKAGFCPFYYEKQEQAIDYLAALAFAPPAPAVNIDAAANRLMMWRLPDDFSPDCGISFDGRKPDAMGYERTWPVGTNLLSVEQAKDMLEYVLAVPPAPAASEPAAQEPDCWAILTPNGSRLVSPQEAQGHKGAYPLYTAPQPPAASSDEQDAPLVLTEGLAERLCHDMHALCRQGAISDTDRDLLDALISRASLKGEHHGR